MTLVKTQSDVQRHGDLADLLNQAREHHEQQQSPNTRRNYDADWRTFRRFCDDYRLESLPATPDTVAAYIEHLLHEKMRAPLLKETARSLVVEIAGRRRILKRSVTRHKMIGDMVEFIVTRKPATITRHIFAIRQKHLEANHMPPTEHPAILGILKGIRREKGGRPAKKKALTTEVLKDILGTIDAGTLKGLRDKALLLIGFAGTFRRSELVGIQYGHIEWYERGITVFLPYSKTDKESKGEMKAIVYGAHEGTCPVRNLKRWLDETGILSGPVFRRLQRHQTLSNKGLTAQSVNLILKSYLTRAGYDANAYGGHSLRSGSATEARRNQAPTHVIKSMGNWKKEETMHQYIQVMGLFENAGSSYLDL